MTSNSNVETARGRRAVAAAIAVQPVILHHFPASISENLAEFVQLAITPYGEVRVQLRTEQPARDLAAALSFAADPRCDLVRSEYRHLEWTGTVLDVPVEIIAVINPDNEQDQQPQDQQPGGER